LALRISLRIIRILCEENNLNLRAIDKKIPEITLQGLHKALRRLEKCRILELNITENKTLNVHLKVKRISLKLGLDSTKIGQKDY
jgi:DNA-binding HxlR family transcriptional regulator